MVEHASLRHCSSMTNDHVTTPEARLELSSAAFVMTAILALFMLLLAVRGFFASHAAATGFGIGIVDPADLFYLRVKGDRDLSTALALLALLALRRPLPLALFIGVATVQPIFDCLLVATHPRGSVAYALSVHGSAALYGIVLALLLWREHARARRRAPQRFSGGATNVPI
jgi:hypothetical protein